jgi:hypothetical protein
MGRCGIEGICIYGFRLVGIGCRFPNIVDTTGKNITKSQKWVQFIIIIITCYYIKQKEKWESSHIS